MCCREGVDKAPKAPKTSFVSAAILVDSSHLSNHIGKKGRLGTAKKSAAPSVPRNEQGVELETVHLADGQRLSRSERTPPKAFRSLNRLHDNVTKGMTALVTAKTQPSFDYIKEKHPQIPFSKTNASAETSSDKSSTDYDIDWMGYLPSPSVLLGKPRGEVGPLPEHTSTDDSRSWLSFPQSHSALSRRNDATYGSPFDTHSLEGPNLSQFNEDESEIEAAMVGLTDSITVHEDSQVQVATAQTSSQADAYPRYLPAPNESTPKIYHCPAIEEKGSGTSRLFFSTESPEKVAEPGQKRKVGVDDQEEDPSESAPVPKRPRVDHEHDQPPGPSSSAEGKIPPLAPVVKPGQPAWVYEFDPAFIAEWQDIVDFV